MSFKDTTKLPKKVSLHFPMFETRSESLLLYRGLIGWLKHIDPRKHLDLQLIYVTEMSRIYRKEMKEMGDLIKISKSKANALEDLDYSM